MDWGFSSSTPCSCCKTRRCSRSLWCCAYSWWSRLRCFCVLIINSTAGHSARGSSEDDYLTRKALHAAVGPISAPDAEGGRIAMFRVNDPLARWTLVGLAILGIIVAVRLLIGLW